MSFIRCVFLVLFHLPVQNTSLQLSGDASAWPLSGTSSIIRNAFQSDQRLVKNLEPEWTTLISAYPWVLHAHTMNSLNSDPVKAVAYYAPQLSAHMGAL